MDNCEADTFQTSLERRKLTVIPMQAVIRGDGGNTYIHAKVVVSMNFNWKGI